MLIFERLEHLKKLWFFDANYLSDSLAIPKKIFALTRNVFPNYPYPFPFPFPFPQNSQKREWTIPRFSFPQGNDHRWKNAQVSVRSVGFNRPVGWSQSISMVGSVPPTGLNLLQGAKFQGFLSGKSVFLNSKFQIREFHAYWMEWGEVLER